MSTERPEGRASAALPDPDAPAETADQELARDLPPAEGHPPSYGYGSPAAATDPPALEPD